MNRRVLTLFAAVLVLLPPAASAQTFLVNRIVLRVNERIATLIDFQRQLGERRQAVLTAPDLDDERRQALLADLGRTVMAEMYEELLLLSRADQLGAKTTQIEVDEAVANMRERMGLTSDEEYRRSLQAAGLTDKSLRERLRRNLLVQQVIGREVQSMITFEEDELRRVWRDNPEAFTLPPAVRLQDIVVLSEGRDPAAVAAAAAQVHAELTAGAPMEEVARRGAAAGTTTDLVDLGWVEQGDLDPALERAAWDLPVGGVSPPVEGRGGLHVLRLAERRAASMRPFEEVKQALEARERQRRMALEYGKYLRGLEQQAHVVMRVPPEAEGFRGLSDAGPELELPPEPNEGATTAPEGDPATAPDPAEAAAPTGAPSSGG